jgi:hypothetical protein
MDGASGDRFDKKKLGSSISRVLFVEQDGLDLLDELTTRLSLAGRSWFRM